MLEDERRVIENAIFKDKKSEDKKVLIVYSKKYEDIASELRNKYPNQIYFAINMSNYEKQIKDISAEIIESKSDETPDEILSISPYFKLPILVDRDLALHDPSVIMEYLDERFPHPPLLPVYPVARANCRTLMLRIDREWCPMIDALIEGKKSEKELMKIREELLHEISSIAPTFKEFKFFMNEDFTLVDCFFAPILWRLPSLGIKLPINRHLKPLIDYQNSVFERPGFLDSLSSLERDLKSDF